MEENIFKPWENKSELVLKKLQTNKRGLSRAVYVTRQKEYGPNEISTQGRRSALGIFLAQLKSPLIIILFFASAISGFLGEVTSTIIIVAMVFFSAIVSFTQEYRSEKTIELLKNKTALKATVLRDGKKKTILAQELTIGDIVLLGFGQVIPADLRLIEIDDLALNEAVLTGESFPVEKTAEPLKIDDPIPQNLKNTAFMGTHVAQGSGSGVVVAIGKDTELGRTAKMLSKKEVPSEFQKGVSDFGIFLFKIILIFSLFVFIFLALFKGSWIASLLFTLSIAVGISPELLPMIITINLSRAARVMAKGDVIVKKLIAIEDLGNADILCTDKTGTITEGKISLKHYDDFSRKKSSKVLDFAMLCNDYFVKKSDAINPLDQAIVDYEKAEDIKSLRKEYTLVEDISFDFQRRRMSVIAQKKKQAPLLITKGAPEEVLSACQTIEISGENKPLRPHLKSITAEIIKQESNGFKVLLIAYKEIGNQEKYTAADETGLTLLGYLVFHDPLKKTAAESLAQFKALGIAVKLLTGDTAASAKWLSREIGFPPSKVILGSDLDNLDEEHFKKAANEFMIFAKVTPEHKLKIVKALKESGHNVAFLGDGVNDAPALKAADVGISVDGATDVAREAADVVLLKKSLTVLIQGIKEGRRTFGNTIKYIFCTISSNYGNMFSVVGASIILPFIPMLPVQILLLNFLSDMPMLAVSTDTVDEEYLRKPKHWNIQTIRKFMNYFGLISSAFDFMTYGFLLLIVGATMPLFQVGWFWQSFLTEVLLIFVVRTRKSFWKSRPSMPLVLAFIFTVALVLLIMYTPMAGFFGFARMPLWINLCLIALSCLYFLVVDFGKKAFYKRYDI